MGLHCHGAIDQIRLLLWFKSSCGEFGTQCVCTGSLVQSALRWAGAAALSSFPLPLQHAKRVTHGMQLTIRRAAMNDRDAASRRRPSLYRSQVLDVVEAVGFANNFYDFLEISKDATSQEIKKAYRKYAGTLSPSQPRVLRCSNASQDVAQTAPRQEPCGGCRAALHSACRCLRSLAGS